MSVSAQQSDGELESFPVKAASSISSSSKGSYLQLGSLSAIETAIDTEFSEDDETEGMKRLANTAISIKDDKGEIHAVKATIDTGASSSFISRETVDYYGFKEQPLVEDDIKDFTSPVGYEKCRPQTYVQVPVKSKKLGIDGFVNAKIRVLDGTGFEIIFGRPFIGRHHILAKLPKFDNTGKPLWTLKGERSEAQKTKDQATKEKDRETASALGLIQTVGSPLKGPVTTTSAGPDSSNSTTSRVANTTEHGKELPNAGSAITTDTKKSTTTNIRGSPNPEV